MSLFTDKYRLSEEQVLAVLARSGAVLTDDHFVYTSGRHGSAYVNKDDVYPDIDATFKLCEAIAYEFLDQRIEVVVAPEVGGVILEWATALNLREFAPNPHRRADVIGVYAEKVRGEDGKPTGEFVLNRGYAERVRGKRVLVVDDILTTGGSVEAVVRAVLAAGGIVVGVAVLVNRGGVTADTIGVEILYALANVSLESWPEEDCPMCKEGRPINIKVGKGREYLANKAKTAVPV